MDTQILNDFYTNLHPLTHHEIIDFLKRNDEINYRKFSKMLLKMSDKEFDDCEVWKHQYENK